MATIEAPQAAICDANLYSNRFKHKLNSDSAAFEAQTDEHFVTPLAVDRICSCVAQCRTDIIFQSHSGNQRQYLSNSRDRAIESIQSPANYF